MSENQYPRPPQTRPDTSWEAAAKGLLRIAMIRREMSYADLVKALAEWGIEENERNLRNKIARGTFSATFFLQCLAAMGCEELDIHPRYFPKPGEPIAFKSRTGWPKVEPGES